LRFRYCNDALLLDTISLHLNLKRKALQVVPGKENLLLLVIFVLLAMRTLELFFYFFGLGYFLFIVSDFNFLNA